MPSPSKGSASPPTVIVSKSEPSEMVAKLGALGLNALWGEPGSDYVWFPHTQRWAIERKTVSNLLGSLKTRQLVEQTQRGVKEFDRYIILIEGEYRRRGDGVLTYYSPADPRARDGWVESGWQWGSVEGMLFDLKLLGAFVEHWPVLYDAATGIARLVLTTTNGSHKFVRERQRPEIGSVKAVLGGELYSDAVWALCALPGVGPEVAEAAIEAWGCLLDAVNHFVAPGASDLRVNGKRLGEKRASRIREALTAKLS